MTFDAARMGINRKQLVAVANQLGSRVTVPYGTVNSGRIDAWSIHVELAEGVTEDDITTILGAAYTRHTYPHDHVVATLQRPRELQRFRQHPQAPHRCRRHGRRRTALERRVLRLLPTGTAAR